MVLSQVIFKRDILGTFEPFTLTMPFITLSSFYAGVALQYGRSATLALLKVRLLSPYNIKSCFKCNTALTHSCQNLLLKVVNRCRSMAGTTKTNDWRWPFLPCPWMSPQILSGASSSRRMGCERKISRDLRHSPRISFSVSWTFLPGRDPRTAKKRGKLTTTEFLKSTYCKVMGNWGKKSFLPLTYIGIPNRNQNKRSVKISERLEWQVLSRKVQFSSSCLPTTTSQPLYYICNIGPDESVAFNSASERGTRDAKTFRGRGEQWNTQ